MRSLISFRRKRQGEGDFTGRFIPHGYYKVTPNPDDNPRAYSAVPIVFANPFSCGLAQDPKCRAKQEQS